MVKVKGPMFSVSASGTFADAIEYMCWLHSPFRKDFERSGVAYIRRRSLPLIATKSDLVAIRETLASGVSIWQDENYLDGESRNSWASAASGMGMSGFNRYCQKFVENNPQRGAPWNIPSPE